MERLIETRSDVSACVIGSGRLANVVRTRAAGGGIEYLGAVDEQTLHREYARASLLLMPSRYEGLGRTALEAQAAGTPVVGYDVTGLRDAVRDSGVLVRAGDPAALEAACVALLDEPDRRARLGERARSFVRRTHSQAAATARLEAIYLEVVAGSQARYPTGRGGRE